MVKGLCYNVMHIVVFVLGKPSAEDDGTFLVGQFLVFQVDAVVAFVVDRVVWLAVILPFRRIFPGYYRLGLCSELEVLVLDNAGVWGFGIGVVHHCHALIIVGVQHFLLE